MDESAPVGQESVEDRLLEEIYQLNGNSLGEEAVTCQACGSHLQEDDAVVEYVFRPAGSVRYQIGHVVCGDGRHTQIEVFTLGVRELLVEGRVGLCSDGATQSSWPVLLAPEVVGVSAAATKSLRRVPEGGSTGSNVASGVEERESAKSSYSVETVDHGQVVEYVGDDAVRTAKNGVTRVRTHSKFGFGEFRLRPSGADRGPERAAAASDGGGV